MICPYGAVFNAQWELTPTDDGCHHVVPVKDLREHTLTEDCWCEPIPDEETPTVLRHNSLDRREEYETGRRKPS